LQNKILFKNLNKKQKMASESSEIPAKKPKKSPLQTIKVGETMV